MGNNNNLDQEIQIAREVQMSTLPDFMPEVAGYDVAGQVWPTDETGGDTFDLVAIDDSNIFVLLADATGHGIGPALSALQVQSMLRVSLRLGAHLDEGFRHINAQMVEDLPDDRFVTACFGLVNTATHAFEFHSAGQGPILHFRGNSGEAEWYEPSCFPLGFIDHQEHYKTRSLTLAEGDILALISDGIYEYENEAGELFGMDRVMAVMRQNSHLPMAELVDKMYAEAIAFGGAAPQLDDVTIVFVKNDGDDSASKPSRRTFKRSLASLDEIFAFTEEFFVSRGIDTSLRYAVDLAIDELFTNMVHYNPEEPEEIIIEYERVENGLSVSMTDHQRPPFDITQDAPPADLDSPAEERQEGGLGIHLVKEMVDTIDYSYDDSEGCATITFTKKPEA
ncbi:MAG: SpoIIE family protein phosphatase [Halieaceae bacterium]